MSSLWVGPRIRREGSCYDRQAGPREPDRRRPAHTARRAGRSSPCSPNSRRQNHRRPRTSYQASLYMGTRSHFPALHRTAPPEPSAWGSVLTTQPARRSLLSGAPRHAVPTRTPTRFPPASLWGQLGPRHSGFLAKKREVRGCLTFSSMPMPAR
jgi:hypothetical protein